MIKNDLIDVISDYCVILNKYLAETINNKTFNNVTSLYLLTNINCDQQGLIFISAEITIHGNYGLIRDILLKYCSHQFPYFYLWKEKYVIHILHICIYKAKLYYSIKLFLNSTYTLIKHDLL